MKTLREAGKECTFLLYPMWFWMRWLSMALLYLFNMILYLNGNPVLSIVLLSICVKIIIAPLYRVAVHWQNEVNRQRSILEPRLLEIKKLYKGEEQTNMTLSVYKEMGISPLYALKSLLSAAIQIPVFFAAYHMLSEHIALSGVSFLWISDLALPDRLIQLPFAIPFFGDYLNMLPFVMTSVSLISSFIHTDKSLSEKLHKKQQRSLFLMAAIFFFLLYASPAGMLLYWTMNNILSLLESLYTANKHKITGV
jgi:YidC/Oxa1 family membrane protein insertase